MKKVLTLAALVAATASIVGSSALAFGGQGMQGENRQPDPEKRAQMIEILESKDYDAWIEMVGDNPRGGKMKEEVTEDNFAEFAEKQLERMIHMEEIREAIENEDFDTWHELMIQKFDEDMFAQVIERHQAMENGEQQEQRGPGNRGQGRGQGQGRMQYMDR